MERKQRVLLVDDDEDFTAVFSSEIQRGGFDVEVVHTADDAIRRLNDKIYDAAVVDMNLSGPREDNSDGHRLLRYARGLDEPPALVVCTGTESTQFTANLFQEFGAVFQFLAKSELTDKGSEALLRHIRIALESRRPPRDHRKEMLRVLAGNEREEIWVHLALSTLKPEGGYQGLIRFFQDFLHGLSPLLPTQGSDGPQLRAAEGESGLVGHFWSKGIGGPVFLDVRSVKIEDSQSGVTPAEAVGGTPVRELEQSGVHGTAWKVNGRPRDAYGP